MLQALSAPQRPRRALADSAVVYRGPSMLDGAPIVAIVTGMVRDSKNEKTGAMAQLWILAADEAPHDAVRSGADRSVCGDCPHRGTTCYVTVFQAPRSVYKAHAQKAVDLAGAVRALRARRRAVRLGAYGDPAALPVAVLRALVRAAPGHTGYTHQWRDPRFTALRSLVMASADSRADRDAAHAAGWRTFRVYPFGHAPERVAGEIECPSSRGVSCEACGLCNGSRGTADRRKSITIEAHGARAVAAGKRMLRVLA